MVARAITHSARALYWEGAHGLQERSPEVQSELGLEEEPETVVRPAVVPGKWGGNQEVEGT